MIPLPAAIADKHLLRGRRPVDRAKKRVGQAVYRKAYSVHYGLGTLILDRSNDMTDVTFTNSRADSSANEDLTTLARHGADAFGYKAHLRIDRKLAQLLRLRVSQINNCAYCLNLHYEAARDAGVARPVIDTLTAWWETDFHDDAARAALAYTEAITRVADATAVDHFGERHEALAEHFSPEEILEIIGIVINMNVWTRLKLAEGAIPRLARGQAVASW